MPVYDKKYFFISYLRLGFIIIHSRMTTIINKHNTQFFLAKSELKPLQQALDTAKDKNHYVIVASDYFIKGMKRPTKIYGSFRNSKAICSVLIDEQEKCLYEIIPQDTKCRLFSDLEWNLDWKSKDEIREKITSLVKSRIGDEHEVYILDASKDKKGSFHLHCPTVCFKNIREQLFFWNDIY